MLHYLTMGIVLGLSAGFAPGPLLTLVISETLQHDIKSGIKVACAPIFTDLPIILLTMYVLSKLSSFENILGIISLIGGLFVLYMGYESIRVKGIETDDRATEPKSFTKGILVNALSPHPYLFWFSVGSPTMTKALNLSVSTLLTFTISFYICLVGSKVLLALATGKSKAFLKGNMYLYTLRFLGGILCVLAVMLFYDGMKLLGIIPG